MGVSVILLAGGVGTRMGTKIPKQFLHLNGRPIARHSYDLFQTMPEIDEVIVVCHPNYRSYFKEETSFALPGERRQDSMYNGLQMTACEYICVHDAARPMITKEMVQRALEAAQQHGAATVGMPVKSTIKECNGENFVVNTPDRTKMWEIQTPQIIRRDWLIEGFKKIKTEGLTVTDDVSIAELLGHPVKVVEGAYSNIKITTPEDLPVGVG